MNHRPPYRLIATISLLLAMLAKLAGAATVVSSGAVYRNQTFNGDVSAANTASVSFLSCTFNNGNLDVSGATNCVVDSGTLNAACVIFNTSPRALSVTHNHFVNGPTLTGISGYGPFNSHFDGNTFINYCEPIHIWFIFQSQPQNCTVNDNVMTGTSRNDIELQQAAQGLEVARNFIGGRQAAIASGGGMGISCATGAAFNANNTSPIPPDASGVYVHDNFINLSGINASLKWCVAGIEFMGGGGRCNHNFVYDANNGVAYTETGCFGQPWEASNNVFVACNNGFEPEPSNNGYVTAVMAQTATGNRSFAALASAGCPPLPASAAAWAGTTATAPSSTFTLTASPGSGTIGFTFPALPVAGTLHTFTPASDCGTLTLPAGSSAATIGNLNGGWVYLDTLTAGSLTGSTSAQTLGSSPAGTTATIATLIPTSQPISVTPGTTKPTVTEIDLVTHYSDGSATTQVLVGATGN